MKNLHFKLDEKNSKIYSRIGSRATFGLIALDLAKKIDNLMILTSDVSTSAGLDRYRKSFPDKYLEVGIAEQNLIGIAAGLASENFNVFTTTFAPFQTMRCCEQIKVNLGYMKQKVCLVGLASGLVLGPLGYTHCCVEDLSIMRSIPNMAVISPADCGETAKTIYASLLYKDSVYIRLTGGSNSDIIYTKDYEFVIGRNDIIKEGDQATIISNGAILSESLKASYLLDKKGISTRVVNMHTIKPLDVDNIKKIAKTSKLIITVEEHNIIGGLGSAVAECLSTLNSSPPQLFIGIPDSYKKSGEYEYLKREYKLTSELIFRQIGEKYEQLGQV
tara:strand:- start:3263 stop:4258 length:996 start_codon:yes stop_codon:yes gene_type:complete